MQRGTFTMIKWCSIHAQHFVNPVHNKIHIETTERLWMHAKRKLHLKSGPSRALLSEVHCRISVMPLHKMHIYRQYLKLISENYAICIAMISELRYAVYEVLDGTNCKDVGKVKSPAEPIVSDL